MTDVTDRKSIITESVGPASYAAGGFDVEVSDLATVDISAVLQATGGYTAEVASISGNKAKVKVYSASGTEVTNGTDLSGETVTLLSYGL